MSRRSRHAFTLIELLTVIAITAVLLTIIVVPVIQSFNLTRQAQAFVDAQDRARVLSERISREIGNSVGVRDLSGYVSAQINGSTVSVPASSVAIVVPGVNADGSASTTVGPVQVVLPYSKLDILEPAQGQTLAGGVYVDPRTGLIDPTLKGPKGQVTLPVGIGTTIVRYWIGLRQPVSDDLKFSIRYNEPYSGFLTARNSQRDNLYALYRAEIQPYVWRPAANGSSGPAAYRPNLEYFQADASDTNIVDEDDPNFFTFIPNVDVSNENTGALTATGALKATRIHNWQQAAHLVSDFSRYDLILPVYDKSSRKVKNVNGVPLLLSLAQFRPTRISAETVAGQTASRLGEESSSGAAVAPDVFVTQFGQWSNPVVRTYPILWNPSATTGQNSIYEVGRRDLMYGTAIFAYEPGVSAGDDLTGGTPLFSLDTYDNALNSGTRYPFSLAVNMAAMTPSLRQVFVPYTWNRQTGKVIASFNISEVGDSSIASNINNPDNLPTIPTTLNGSGTAYTALDDPNVTTGVFSDAQFASINEKYNKLYHDYPQLNTILQRFVDLRVTLQGDNSAHSPLYPIALANEPTGLIGKVTTSSGAVNYSRVSIVPGTEVVIGPDQRPGINYGANVRYTRVSENPGPDQYCLNYTDLPEPTDATGLNVDYSVAYPGFANPKATYDPTDFVTAVLQPRYKAGYLQFCSDPKVPLPAGNIRVSYRFQVTGKLTGLVGKAVATQQVSVSDSFSVDYDSRQLIDVLLTVRNYPQSSAPNPQTVTLKSTAAVRNFQR